VGDERFIVRTLIMTNFSLLLLIIVSIRYKIIFSLRFSYHLVIATLKVVPIMMAELFSFYYNVTILRRLAATTYYNSVTPTYQHNIFHLTYFSFLADPTSKVLQI
jgi:hypothetical protein